MPKINTDCSLTACFALLYLSDRGSFCSCVKNLERTGGLLSDSTRTNKNKQCCVMIPGLNYFDFKHIVIFFYHLWPPKNGSCHDPCPKICHKSPIKSLPKSLAAEVVFRLSKNHGEKWWEDPWDGGPLINPITPLKSNIDIQNSHVWKEIHFKPYIVGIYWDLWGISPFKRLLGGLNS